MIQCYLCLQLQSTQIITGTPFQQVSQGLTKVTGAQAGATLVKTVSAPAGIVSNVSINVSMPQKVGVGGEFRYIHIVARLLSHGNVPKFLSLPRHPDLYSSTHIYMHLDISLCS